MEVCQDTETIGVKIANLNKQVAAIAEKLESYSFGLSAIANQLAIDLDGGYEVTECGENRTAYIPTRGRYYVTVASTATPDGKNITIRAFPAGFADWTQAVAFAAHIELAAKIAREWAK